MHTKFEVDSTPISVPYMPPCMFMYTRKYYAQYVQGKGVSEGEVFSNILYSSFIHMNKWIRLSLHHIGVLRQLLLSVGQSGLRKSSSRQNIRQDLAVKLFLRIASQGNTVVCIISARSFCEDMVRALLYDVEVLVVANCLHWCEVI